MQDTKANRSRVINAAAANGLTTEQAAWIWAQMLTGGKWDGEKLNDVMGYKLNRCATCDHVEPWFSPWTDIAKGEHLSQCTSCREADAAEAKAGLITAMINSNDLQAGDVVLNRGRFGKVVHRYLVLDIIESSSERVEYQAEGEYYTNKLMAGRAYLVQRQTVAPTALEVAEAALERAEVVLEAHPMPTEPTGHLAHGSAAQVAHYNAHQAHQSATRAHEIATNLVERLTRSRTEEILHFIETINHTPHTCERDEYPSFDCDACCTERGVIGAEQIIPAALFEVDEEEEAEQLEIIEAEWARLQGTRTDIAHLEVGQLIGYQAERWIVASIGGTYEPDGTPAWTVNLISPDARERLSLSESDPGQVLVQLMGEVDEQQLQDVLAEAADRSYRYAQRYAHELA